MKVPTFLNSIEQGGLSVWIRESDSPFAYYFVLLMHNLGLALIVGTSLVIGLRLLGVAPDLPLKPMKKFFTICWIGVWVSIVSGILLLTSYPTKALTNPLFYLKLIFVAIGVWITRKIERAAFADENASDEAIVAAGRSLAVRALVVWIAALSAGRLLAYSFKYLLYPSQG